MGTLRKGHQTLLITHPDLCKEWDYVRNAPLKPSDISAGSHKKVWWICNKGHVWDEIVSNRTSRNSGCVYCSNHRILPGYNDLATLQPDLANEWDYEKNKSLSPKEVSVGTSTKVWWKCSKGHSWNARISSRTIGCGCPYCSGKCAIPGINDLKTTNPELINEWNYEKNIIIPNEVLAGSSKKVWWKCNKGHEWEASVEHRALRGDNCPYCSGRKVLQGFNDLAFLYPELAKEWNYSKNNSLLPKDVTTGSGQKVWWIGRCGHEWEAAICNRVQGTECPYCAGQKVLSGYNDLSSQYPEIAKEWDYDKNDPLTPNDVTVGSGKKVWWKCSQSHEWESTITNRVKAEGCPYCSGKKILSGYNDLASLRPSIAAEWNYEKNESLTPNEVAVGSNKKVWWKCSFGHEWVSQVNSRTSGNTSCPYCSNHRVLIGFNDFASQCPEIAKEWNYDKNELFKPDEYTVGSNKRVWWKCSKGHEWQATIANRTSGGHNCPYCSGSYVISGETDLQSKFPEIAKEWDYEKNSPMTPREVLSKSEKKVWWICAQGHSYQMTIAHRTDRAGNCPYCSGHKVLIGFNDLESQNSVLANEWDYKKNFPLKPTDITARSGKKVWWLGKCGHSWDAVIASRSAGASCPYCSNPPKLVLSGFNDLQTRFPQIAAEWHPNKNGALKPTEVTSMSHEVVWWLGACGHEWQAAVHDRGGGNGCPFCAGRRVLVGFNDLESNFPILAQEWHPTKNGKLLPSQVTTGSGINAWWKCSHCGNEWKAEIASRTNGNGCPTCANEKQTSFPEQATYYYLSQRFTAINRYNDGLYELDVYLPELMIGIEYDGAYYHDDPNVKIRDGKKQKHFDKKNIRLIRIKEDSQNTIVGDVIFYKVNSSYNQLSWAIQSAFRIIDSSVSIPDIDISRDQGKIHEQYILSEKENSLAVVYPELVAEWDYEKNRIDPSRVSSKSGKKVWWKCQYGHEWQTSISHRANGRSCPECAKKTRAKSIITTRLKRSGSFQDAFPEIAKEWHPTLNGELKPSDVLAKSSIKVWWKCSICGNEWEASPGGRAQGTGCPECGKQKSASSRIANNLILKGSLLENAPELAKEWHKTKNNSLLPSEVTSGSHISVWWICSKCGFEWKAKISDRAKGNKCPSCAKRIRIETRISNKIINEGSLQDYSSVIASEWNQLRNGELLPSDVTPSSHKKVWWLGKCGHEWQDNISNRTTRNAGCPYCSNHRVLPGFNDLFSINPSLASEWNYEKNKGLTDKRGIDISTPDKVSPNSGQKVWWICDKGHEWDAVICSRMRGNNCPFCSNQKVLTGYNDISTTNPEMLEEWNYEKNTINPKELLAGSDKKAWWICSKCGYEWQTEIRLRAKGYGCPNCARIRSVNSRSKAVMCIETGIIYASSREAALQTNNSQSCISLCCNGKQNTAGGYHWKYADE